MDSVAGSVLLGQEAQFQTKPGEIQIEYLKEDFYDKGSEPLEQVAQRSGGHPVPGDNQGRDGPGSEQLDPAVDVLVHCRGCLG